jgi:uncharacterized protein (DUF2336 family)
MTSGAQTLIAELDESLKNRSDSERFTILRRVTDLFLQGAASYSAEQVRIFDDVMVRLLTSGTRDALVELSGKLAAVDNAPVNVVGQLAREDEALISVPLLTKSNVLTDHDLAEIAATKGRTQLVAVAGRSPISETVTDALLERGGPEILQMLAANKDARFSELGMVKIVYAAKADRNLAIVVADRADVPAEMRPFLNLADDPS